MGEDIEKAGYHPADVNGDGKVDAEEKAMYMEFKRKELEDQDAMRDAQRNMAWFSLGGMLFYPAMVVATDIAGLEKASNILGDMAPTYFVAVAGLVAAFLVHKHGARVSNGFYIRPCSKFLAVDYCNHSYSYWLCSKYF